jgi:hypothetical protein
MRTARLAALVASALMTSNCTTLQNQSRVDPQSVAIYPLRGGTACGDTRIPPDTRTGAVNLACILRAIPEGDVQEAIPDSKQTGTTNPQYKLLYNQAIDDPGARNRLMEILVRRADGICAVEMGRLTGDEATTNMFLSTATSGFATAASLVSGKKFSDVLAGFATLSNATRDNVKAQIYRNFGAIQIVKAIFLARVNKLKELRDHTSDSATEYNVDRMITEVDSYHQLCGLDIGETLVDEAVSATGNPTLTQSDQFTAAINGLGTKVDALNKQIAATTDADLKAALTAQRNTLLTQQTQLYTQRSQAQSPAAQPAPQPVVQGDGGAADPPPPPPAPPKKAAK